MEDDMEGDEEDDLETFLVVFFDLVDVDELVFLVVFLTVLFFLLNPLDHFLWLVTLVELDDKSYEESASADEELDSSSFDFSLFPGVAFLVFLAGFLIRVNSDCFFFELGSIFVDCSSGSEFSGLLKSSLSSMSLVGR